MAALPCVHVKRDCKLRVGFALLMRTSDHQSRRQAKRAGEDRHPCPSSLNVGVGHFSGGGGSEFRGSEKKEEKNWHEYDETFVWIFVSLIFLNSIINCVAYFLFPIVFPPPFFFSFTTSLLPY